MSLPNHTNIEAKEAIDTSLLTLWGGVFKNYGKDEYIFQEGRQPNFYHQVIDGKIKMVNETEDGKEFIQGFFSMGQSFGESPIFDQGGYPASAVALIPTVLIRLSISSFKQLLKENFDVHWNLTKLLSQRIIKKSNALRETCCFTPEHRIRYILDNFRKERSIIEPWPTRVKIDYTRREIAAMTGLRVETVIRVMRNLLDKNVLNIKRGKVYY